MFTLKKYFMLKIPLFFKTHFDYFNSQVNNYDNMEREELFIDIKQYFGNYYKVDYYQKKKFMN